jgi:protein SCO1/2
VSVDPDRDTPEKIDKFLSYFDKEMIGLTAKSNNDPLLKDCLKKFKIYATKINFEDEEQHHGLTGYTIDHTILTYLIDDENNYLTHLGANLGEHDLAKEIMSKIKERERQKLQAYKV